MPRINASASARCPGSEDVATHLMAEDKSKQECKFHKIGKCDRGDQCRFVHKDLGVVAEVGKAKSRRKRRRRIARSPSLALEAPKVPEA